MILGENDNLAAPAGHSFRASKVALFLPVAVIAAGYGLLLVWLWSTGELASGIARMAAIVLAFGLPLLMAHAALRYATIYVQLRDGFVQARPGFPHRGTLNIPYADIEDTEIKRGISRLAGSYGTVVLRLKTTERISICDLRDPEVICGEILQRVSSLSGHQTGVDAEPAKTAIAAPNR
ncbi:MAG: hypothetical protein AB3N20_13895 [Rhizobiaceae bacterium]